jgi:hypothetical protein
MGRKEKEGREYERKGSEQRKEKIRKEETEKRRKVVETKKADDQYGTFHMK